MTAIIIILIYHYLLISIVLFEPVECEDLEACDVKDPNEDGFFLVEHKISTILLIYPPISSHILQYPHYSLSHQSGSKMNVSLGIPKMAYCVSERCRSFALG